MHTYHAVDVKLIAVCMQYVCLSVQFMNHEAYVYIQYM